MRVTPLCLAATAAAAFAVVPAGAQTADRAAAADPGQAFFRTALLTDTRTKRAIRTSLKSGAYIVDPATTYADLTGDGKTDAIVRVHSTGAAGVIAVFVFSSDGSAKGALRVVYRNQTVIRALTQVTDDDQLQIDQPAYAAGDELCCPGKLTRRRYRWSAATHAFRRTSLETITIS